MKPATVYNSQSPNSQSLNPQSPNSHPPNSRFPHSHPPNPPVPTSQAPYSQPLTATLAPLPVPTPDLAQLFPAYGPAPNIVIITAPEAPLPPPSASPEPAIGNEQLGAALLTLVLALAILAL